MQDEGREVPVVQRLGLAQRGDQGQISIARKHLVNMMYENPTERYTKVKGILKEHEKEITDWDLICFSAMFLMSMSSAFSWLLPEGVKAIAQNVHFAHYYDPDTNIGIQYRRKGVDSAIRESVRNNEGRSDSNGEQESRSSIPDATDSES
jgi:hypothetical protein